MTLYLVLGGFIAAAIAFILIGRAARPAPRTEDDARRTFADLPDFDPGEVHAKNGAAISYDPVRNIVMIWDKAGGARLVDPGGVAGWRARLRSAPRRSGRRPFVPVRSSGRRRPHRRRREKRTRRRGRHRGTGNGDERWLQGGRVFS